MQKSNQLLPGQITISETDATHSESPSPGTLLVGIVQPTERSLATTMSTGSIFANFAQVDEIFRKANPTASNLNRLTTPASMENISIFRVHLAPGTDLAQALAQLQSDPAVAFAEPDYTAHLIAAPNDPFYPGQWGLTQINVPTVWDTQSGESSVVIAIVDAGIDVSHPDLAGQLWTNPGEIAGNGLDDDNNGYTDDIHGWNIVDDNANLSDNTGHGTEVAGVTGAITDNNIGVTGVCGGCQIMLLKVTQPGGIANYSDIIEAVNYAAQKGANVINLSLGGSSDSISLRLAVETAAATTVVVGGAGNDNSDTQFYPAAYEAVLAVAGTTQTDTKVNTSNYGTWVDVSAPGELITTTFDGGTYGMTSGTSMAAPFASGLAGLLISEHPDWSANAVRAQIIQTTENIDAINPSLAGKLGSGRIDAAQAFSIAPEPLLSLVGYTVNGLDNGRPEPGSTVDLDITLFNEWADAENVLVTLTSSGPYVTIVDNTTSYGSINAFNSKVNLTPFRVSIAENAPYTHDLIFSLNITADGGYVKAVSVTMTTASGIEQVSGLISSNTTWHNDKQYIVSGNILVQSGVTLTIEAGTTIRVNPGVVMRIDGGLVAIGTEADPILFTSKTGSTSQWQGIIFSDESFDAVVDSSKSYINGTILQYAIVEHALTGIICENSSPYISHNTIQHNGTGIIAGESAAYYASEPIVVYNSIQNNVNGLQTGNSPLVAYNTISNNSQWGIYADRGGTGNLVELKHNLINNNGTGLKIWLSDQTLTTNNTFIYNQIGISVEGWNNSDSAIISNNNILYNREHDLQNITDYAYEIDIKSNWWGTTNSSLIGQHILDFQDDFNLGTVSYIPILTEPNSEAPAYLSNITVSPNSPIGIETAIFELHFSRPMNQAFNPTVTFGKNSPFSTFSITENAQWINDSTWQATMDITSLIPRGTYTLNISEAIGSNDLQIPTDTNHSFVVDYAGEITDQSPPGIPSVLASGIDGNPTGFTASWTHNPSDTNITGYRYTLGSAPGTMDIINWTTTTQKHVQVSSLGLVEGEKYWVMVQTRNSGGLWSEAAHSSFISGKELERVFLPIVVK